MITDLYTRLTLQAEDEIRSLQRMIQSLENDLDRVQVDLLQANTVLEEKDKILHTIVRVHYFVRGGFVGYRSRASSKHLSPHLPVGSLDSSGVKQGLRCT
ncbi:hypothetical protein TNCV_2548461 [Trichonephila clavipes]|nr:hypothetical protein TNCV_2548461 [Trichonephila clavipes]